MDWPVIDLIVRGSGVSMLIMLGLILWRDYRSALAARLAIMLTIGTIGYFIFEIPGSNLELTPVNIVLSTLTSSIYGLFWIFALSWFNDENHVSWQSWSIILITTLVSLCVWIMRTYGADKIITIPVRFIWMTFIIWGLWSAWRGRDNDLIEARRNLRFLFIAMVGGAIAIITIIYLIYNIFLDDMTPYIFTITINIIITCITYFLILSIIRAHPKDLFASIEKSNSKDMIMDSKQEELKERLEQYMMHERPYRNENLTITIVASALGQQEYRLRRLINGKLGYRNFSTFLNHYRLIEVKEALADPDQIDVSILTIALDSGFGSLAPFNRAFRQAEGITPTQYRKDYMPVAAD